MQFVLGYSFGHACADLGLLEEHFGVVRLASLSLISVPVWFFMQLIGVVVKAFFEGKVKALYDLFRRGQEIAYIRGELLPYINWIELHPDLFDSNWIAVCRALRETLAKVQAENEKDLIECADVLW